MSLSSMTKLDHRLTPVQVDALNVLSAFNAGECSASGLAALTSPRTVASLKRRGYVNEDGTLTPVGTDVLNAYV